MKMWSYLNTSYSFNSIDYLPKLYASSSWWFYRNTSSNCEWVDSRLRLSITTRIRSQTDTLRSITSTTNHHMSFNVPCDSSVPLRYSALRHIICKLMQRICTDHLASFIMAVTESSPVSRKAFMASAFEHFVYYITILMLSSLMPSAGSSSIVVSWGASGSATADSAAGFFSSSTSTGLLNWLISFCPVWSPSMLGFPKTM